MRPSIYSQHPEITQGEEGSGLCDSLPAPHPGLAQPVQALKSTRKCHFPFEEV